MSDHEAKELVSALRADDPNVTIVLVGVDRAAHEPAAATIDGTDKLTVTLRGDRCPLDELEREVIRQAMLRCDGNVSRAARYLGITRQTLVYRLRKHGL
jgi:DNA-binding NtrC family response regulator